MTEGTSIADVLEGRADWVVVTGDCLSVLPTIPAGSVGAVLTDPPYGLHIDYASFTDSPENVRTLAGRWLPVARACATRVCFTPGLGADRFYPAPDHTACWFMEAGGYRCSWGFGMWQPILCYGKDPYLARGLGARPDVIRTNHFGRADAVEHPCPKPVAVWMKFVSRWSMDDELVLDPFCGSGTTGVVCVKTGRRFIGIEIDPGYADIARRRIRDAEPVLFTKASTKQEEMFA